MTNYDTWKPYSQMNIFQKINVKANSVGAMLRFNEMPNMQPPLMFFALTEFNHSPDVYSTPFQHTKCK